MTYLYCVEELLRGREGERDALLSLAQWTDGAEIAIDHDDPRWAAFIGDRKIVPQGCPGRAPLQRNWEQAKKAIGDDTPGVPFADTYVCRSQRNCELCRDPESGREWRRGMRSVHPTPGNLIDFKCPYGKKWGYKYPITGPGKLGTVAEAITIEHNQGLGDAVMLSGAIRDLHKTHPGRFTVRVKSGNAELFKHNPYTSGPGGGRSVRVECWPTEYSDNTTHFLSYFHRKLALALGIEIRPTVLCGDVHLSDAEKSSPPLVDGPYWIVFPRNRGVMDTKTWPIENFQAVVSHFKGRLRFVQAAGGDRKTPELKGAINLTGKTSLRDLVRLVYHAEGCVSLLSAGMHLAAAVPVKPGALERRPCVVIAGGIESPNFIQYPNHTFLSEIGHLPCCASGACFRYQMGHCDFPVDGGAVGLVPKCMKSITPARVIEAIEGYLTVTEPRRAQIAEAEQAERKRHAKLIVLAEENFPTCAVCDQYDGTLENGLAVKCRAKRRSCSCKDGRVPLYMGGCPIGKWSMSGRKLVTA